QSLRSPPGRFAKRLPGAAPACGPVRRLRAAETGLARHVRSGQETLLPRARPPSDQLGRLNLAFRLDWDAQKKLGARESADGGVLVLAITVGEAGPRLTRSAASTISICAIQHQSYSNLWPGRSNARAACCPGWVIRRAARTAPRRGGDRFRRW